MKTRLRQVVFLMLIASFVSNAQQPLSINELRSEIQKRETLDIPQDLKETNNRRLSELREQLHKLVSQELTKLIAYRDSLVLAEDEAKIVGEKIQAYQAEQKSLESLLRLGPTIASTSPETLPAATLAPPAPVPVQSPIATTVTPLSAGAGKNSQVTLRNCAEVTTVREQNVKAVTQVEEKMCDLINAVKARPNKQIRLTGPGAPDYFDLLVILMAKKSTPDFLVEAEEARVDKQVGSTPASSGSTSLVVKGGAPAILGFAVENGALTQSTSGTTLTFRGNPLGIYHALSNHGFFDSYLKDENTPLTSFLRKTSFAFSFDTDRGPQPGVFTATKEQLSSVSARIEFINNRRPSVYTREWNDFLRNQAQQFADTIASSKSAFVTTESSTRLDWRDPVLQSWYLETQAALAAITTADKVEEVLRKQIDKLPVEELSSQTLTQLSGLEESIGAYLSGRDFVLDKIAKGTLVTFDYTNKRSANVPDTSNFTVIAEKGASGKLDFTLNASLTIFNKRPFLAGPNAPQVGRLRDFTFAGQLDFPFGSVREAGQFVFWTSGKYQRMTENGFTEAGAMIPNTKGDIAVGQFGLKVPIKGLGIKFPISVTFANRTELIKEKEVRGNFGFTFDLDTLFSKFKPF